MTDAEKDQLEEHLIATFGANRMTDEDAAYWVKRLAGYPADLVRAAFVAHKAENGGRLPKLEEIRRRVGKHPSLRRTTAEPPVGILAILRRDNPGLRGKSDAHVLLSYYAATADRDRYRRELAEVATSAPETARAKAERSLMDHTRGTRDRLVDELLAVGVDQRDARHVADALPWGRDAMREAAEDVGLLQPRLPQFGNAA